MAHKEIGAVLKRFESPDEVRLMQKGKFELVDIGGMTIGRRYLRAGLVQVGAMTSIARGRFGEPPLPIRCR